LINLKEIVFWQVLTLSVILSWTKTFQSEGEINVKDTLLEMGFPEIQVMHALEACGKP
jgi:hypothetical protein